jgi:flagellar hook-basal body complex protein FliE
MTVTALNAAAAYGNVANLLNKGAKPQTDLIASAGSPLDFAATSAPGGDFASLLAQNVQGVIDQGRASEQMALDTISGKASTVDMVTAISQTEMAIETMVTVRDRVISAYEQIMQMPI